MNRSLILTAAFLCGMVSTNAAAQDGPDERAFAERFLPQLQETSPESSVYSEPGDPLRINFDRADGSDGPVTVNLHRMFQYCQTISLRECDIEMAEFIVGMRSEPAQSEAENLRIIVRDASYMEYVQGSVAGSAPQPVYKKIGEDLFAILVLDGEQSISIIGQDTLEGMGLDADGAWERARQETLTRIPTVGESIDFDEGLVSFEGDEYVGSMALLRDEWGKLASHQKRELAVALPSDQFFLALRVDDDEELQQFKALAVDICEIASRCISPNVYRFGNSGWMIAK